MKRFKILAGVATVSLSSGDGSLDVNFDEPFDSGHPPTVVVGFQESLGAGKRGFVAATSVEVEKFTVTVDSDSAAGTIDVGWIAMDRQSSEKVAQ
jgi:hypothetical protein